MDITSKNARSEFISRAKAVGYKNMLPKLPKNQNSSTMSGYKKRMANWLRQLEVAESY